MYCNVFFYCSFYSIDYGMLLINNFIQDTIVGRRGTVAQASDCKCGDCAFDPTWGNEKLFIDIFIFSCW